MKTIHNLAQLFAFVILTLAAGPIVLAQDIATIGRTYHSPEDAVNALAIAVNYRDTNAIAEIFGPGIKDIRSSDPVEAQREVAAFAKQFNASNYLEHVDDNRCVLDTGADRWPFPIPLVRTNGAWHFDTAAGRNEILNRRIGYDELRTIESLRAGVEAQRQYASEDHNGDGVLAFAQKFISSPGKKDGLYWSPDIDGEISPLGPLFVQAQSEGYKKTPGAGSPTPFHGYYFKILTRQGRHAPAGAYNYIINGYMIGGFALIAWPAQYGESGIMTFIVNQQGRVYQKDFGSKTALLVKRISAYDPDSAWMLSPD
ncbi:MAG TPA: DUF2950 domain-containing protein [Verrucomicrobiae bacterium]|jgi:hypothetical protein